jgi:hypothetical protein
MEQHEINKVGEEMLMDKIKGIFDEIAKEKE